ncbi:MAG: sulfite exporter TauE/SafE family protein [Erythrobacter sp.]
MEDLTGFTTVQVAAALSATFLSAFVRGLTGFGMAILLVPVLALAMLPVEAVLIANFVGVLIGLIEIRRLVRDAEKSAWTICAFVVLATPLGLWLLTITGPDLARLIIALVALSAFAIILFPGQEDETYGPIATGGVGVISGLLTGFAGMPGPPVVPYYVGRALPRAIATASMLLIFTVAAATGLVAGAVFGEMSWRLCLLGLTLFPAVLLGNWVGMQVSGRVSDRTWRICVGVVLAGAALAALYRLL